jgi:hypothetical protein
MTPTRAISAAVARGAVFHLSFSALALGALAVWARYCAAHATANRS